MQALILDTNTKQLVQRVFRLQTQAKVLKRPHRCELGQQRSDVWPLGCKWTVQKGSEESVPQWLARVAAWNIGGGAEHRFVGTCRGGSTRGGCKGGSLLDCDVLAEQHCMNGGRDAECIMLQHTVTNLAYHTGWPYLR